MAAPGDEDAQVELTYNYDPEELGGARNFGHLAYAVENIYDTCQKLMDAGVTINRPPSPCSSQRGTRPRSHGLRILPIEARDDTGAMAADPRSEP